MADSSTDFGGDVPDRLKVTPHGAQEDDLNVRSAEEAAMRRLESSGVGLLFRHLEDFARASFGIGYRNGETGKNEAGSPQLTG